MKDPRAEEARFAEPIFVRKLWTDCWHNLPGLLGANILLLLWCVPAAVAAALQFWVLAMIVFLPTAGPALVGLFVYVANLVLDRRASFWRDSLRGFRSGIGGGLLWAGIATLAWTANRLALTHALHSGLSAGSVALWAGQGMLCLVLWVIGVHALSLAALYRQGVTEALRNALLLTVAHPASGLGLVAAGVLTILLSQLLSGGPLIIGPALCAVLGVNTTLLLVQHDHP